MDRASKKRLLRGGYITWAVLMILGSLVLVFSAARTNDGTAGKFQQVLVDDFNETQKLPVAGENSDAAWAAYSGQPGGNSRGLWSPANVSIGGGELLIKTTREGNQFVTGGVGNGIHQTYGKWEVKMRMPYSKSVKFVVQLWPTKGWPPEIDFAEGGGATRRPDGYSAYFHWGAPDTQKPGNKQQTRQRLTGIDLSDWHTVGVTWRPGIIQYLIDGRVWAENRSPDVPDQDMWLAIQTEAVTDASDDAPPTSNLQVDNVKIWSWVP